MRSVTQNLARMIARFALCFKLLYHHTSHRPEFGGKA